MSEERQYTNGHYRCALSQDEAEMIQESHLNTKEILLYAKYLENLKSLKTIEDKLLNAAIGKGWLDVETHNKVIRSNNILFGFIVVSLIGTIVFLLTGQTNGWVTLHQ
jgi:hypothetical protein